MLRAEHIPEPPLEPHEEKHPRCPFCGEECEKYYRWRHGTIIGCDNCVEEVDAWEEMDNDGL